MSRRESPVLRAVKKARAEVRHFALGSAPDSEARAGERILIALDFRDPDAVHWAAYDMYSRRRIGSGWEIIGRAS